MDTYSAHVIWKSFSFKKRPNISGKQVVYMYTVPSTNIGNLGKYVNMVKKKNLHGLYFLSFIKKKKKTFLPIIEVKQLKVRGGDLIVK